MKKSQLGTAQRPGTVTRPADLPRRAAQLHEDEVKPTCTHWIRRARNKYVGKYRRQAAKRVSKQGGRGPASTQEHRAKAKAEVFEEALSDVSARLAVLAQRAADDLRSSDQRRRGRRRRDSGRRSTPMLRPRRLVAAVAGRSGGVAGALVNAPALASSTKKAQRAGTRAKGARR